MKSILLKLLQIELKGQADAVLEGVARDMSVGEKLMMNLVAKGLSEGDRQTIKDIFEMLEGKPTQPMANDPDNPIEAVTFYLPDNARDKVIDSIPVKPKTRTTKTKG